MLHFLRFAQHSSKQLGRVALLLGVLSASATPAIAEGSKELTDNNGFRPYLEYRNDNSLGNIPRRTIIKVFAKKDETVYLGSSAVGLDKQGNSIGGSIVYRSPSNVATSCPTNIGQIRDLAAELAGSYHPITNLNSNAFQACQFTADRDGIWEIEFVSPNPGINSGPTQNPPVTLARDPWAQNSGVPWVAAWDVTVRDKDGNNKLGRVYADYLALNLGNNGVALNSMVYIQTKDGYGYTVSMNGIDPFGFIFFANNKGFTNNSSGDPIYRSLQLLAPSNSQTPSGIPSGYNIQRPNVDDVGNNVTHKIFFNPTGPDIAMPANASTPTSSSRPSGSTWLYSPPQPPPLPSNLVFTGVENTPGKAGTAPLGGNFTFNAPSVGAYTITIDLNQNGTYGDGNDRTLIGTAKVGSNTIFWDGLDGNENPVPASTNAYNAQVQMYAGEIHFPFIDPENSPNGIVVQRVKDPGSNPNPPSPYLVSFDDRNTYKDATNPYDFSLCADAETPVPSGTNVPGCYGTAPTQRSALNGVNSSGGAHRWTGNFGDRRGMDTWAFYPSAILNTPAQIEIREADLSITKTDNLTSVAAGSTITYTIVVTNNGPSDVENAAVEDTMPTTLTNVTWTCTASTESSCAAASGTGNINTTVSLKNRGTATYTVRATIAPNATGTIQNTAIVLRPSDVNDPTDPKRTGAGNNSATDTTTLTSPIPNIRLVKRITALNATTFADVIDDVADANDDNWLNWNANYLQGRTGKNLTANDSVPVKPGDSLEYTIYFLSDGGLPASTINLCDLIPPNTTFDPQAFNGNAPRDGGSTSADLGIMLSIDTSIVYLTSIADTPDRGEFLQAGVTTCGSPNSNGAVLVRLSNLARAANKGTPNSYGFIRFRVKVN